MTSGVVLLRGINVGGRNPVRMPDLVACFEAAGYDDVRTHLQSGNVLFAAAPAAAPPSGPELEAALDRLLVEQLGFAVPTVVRSRDELAATVGEAPAGHGSDDLRSDVFFLKAPLTVEEAMEQMPELREGVDAVAPGPGAIYFSRVAAQARRTRIQKFFALPAFQHVTARSWRTTTRLLELLDATG
ncbi:DUF1697 domain-containing protein [Luteimicrobium sp. NPDC057192]|uniref:DUF1697 domain-containing protein n=1 Tax=Luteimicrobium sp. NPDC057192 TaxID=3346042 RepID=UPI00362FD65D